MLDGVGTINRYPQHEALAQESGLGAIHEHAGGVGLHDGGFRCHHQLQDRTTGDRVADDCVRGPPERFAARVDLQRKGVRRIDGVQEADGGVQAALYGVAIGVREVLRKAVHGVHWARVGHRRAVGARGRAVSEFTLPTRLLGESGSGMELERCGNQRSDEFVLHDIS